MSQPQAPASSARFRLVLLVVLLVLLVAAVGFLVYTLTSRDVSAAGVHTGDSGQTKDRGVVQAQARDFLVTLNTYGPDLLDENKQMPSYRSAVEKLLTAKFKESFLANVTYAEQTAVASFGRTGAVYATGVSDIDSDSATVLVAGSFTQSYLPSGATTRVTQPPVGFRVVVTLDKVKGDWLVDSYQPEPDPADASGGPTTIPTLPSTIPTSLPSRTPSTRPSGKPSSQPSRRPSASGRPSASPSTKPTPTGKASP